MYTRASQRPSTIIESEGQVCISRRSALWLHCEAQWAACLLDGFTYFGANAIAGEQAGGDAVGVSLKRAMLLS
jgi:hypothetical protein